MSTPINNPIGWFEIYVNDLPRARQFYETVLATKLEVLPTPSGMPVEMLAFPSSQTEYGAPGALVKMEGMAAGGNSVLVYFKCADCAVEAARVVKAGGQIQQEKVSLGDYGFMALAVDTEGNMLGLHSMQ